MVHWQGRRAAASARGTKLRSERVILRLAKRAEGPLKCNRRFLPGEAAICSCEPKAYERQTRTRTVPTSFS
jgi:hypothetical protein